MKVDRHYMEVYGPSPILMNVHVMNIYTKDHVTNANDQLGQEEHTKYGELDTRPCLSRMQSLLAAKQGSTFA